MPENNETFLTNILNIIHQCWFWIRLNLDLADGNLNKKSLARATSVEVAAGN